MIVMNNMKFGNHIVKLYILLFLISVCCPLKKYILTFTYFDKIRDENG